MENYDLSAFTRDQLHFLLSTAKDEMVKYTQCVEEIERIQQPLEEARKTMSHKYIPIWLILLIVCIALALFNPINSTLNTLGLVAGCFALFLTFVYSLIYIIDRRKAQKDILKYEPQLSNLQQKEKEAINEFKAVLFIPNDYCYEYALTKMLKFVENKQASNWERVTDLYEEHLHRMTMEDSARQSLEQSKIQAEYARQARNRAGWAAAGAWAAAAGIWRR